MGYMFCGNKIKKIYFISEVRKIQDEESHCHHGAGDGGHWHTQHHLRHVSTEAFLEGFSIYIE